MIIDCHTHLGRNEHVKASVSELLESMDSAKIDKALVFACDFNDCPNNYLLSEVKPHRDRLLSVAAIHPHKWKNMTEVLTDSHRIADMYQAGDIVAVKFYTGYDHYFPGDELAREYLTDLEDVGCPAIFHMGDCLCSINHAKLKYAQPLGIDEVAVDYPEMNFIIAHMGNPWVRDTAEVCYKNKNVYTDISGFVYGKFNSDDLSNFGKMLDSYMEVAGYGYADKLLFGTDWPISDQRGYLEALEWASVTNHHSKANGIFSPQKMTENTIKAFKLNV
jgi:predicted TIM-barrel fold metal-dependent hydrolase